MLKFLIFLIPIVTISAKADMIISEEVSNIVTPFGSIDSDGSPDLLFENRTSPAVNLTSDKLRLHFNPSKNEDFGGAGGGWAVPYLNPRIKKVNERTVIVHLPSGKVIKLYKTPNGNYADGYGSSGILTNDKKFTIKTPQNISYIFEKARLVEMQSKNKKTIWRYGSNGLCQSVLTDDNLIAVIYNDLGMLDKVSCKALVWSFKYADTIQKGVPVKRVVKIMNENDQAVFSVNYPTDNTSSMVVISQNHEPKMIVWDPVSKFLIHEGGDDYSFKPLKGGSFEVSKNRSGHFLEYFKQDYINGQTIHQKNSLKTTSNFSYNREGAMQYRKALQSGSDDKVLYRSFYDMAGNLLKEEMEDGSKVKNYLYSKDNECKIITIVNNVEVCSEIFKYGRIVTKKFSTGLVINYK